MGANIVVQIESVGKTYRQGDTDVAALHDVSLQVEEGELLVIIGHSGSGKTTLLQAIAGLLPVTTGQISVCGQELTKMRDRERARFRRRNLGVVFQSFNLLPALTAAEHVALPLLLDGVSAKHVEPRVREALGRVGLERRANQLPDELSGGECQRVAVARALVAMPTVILADEPTGNLDAHSSKLVLDNLRDANRALGRTVILVTHDSQAFAYGTRVVQLGDGRMAEEVSDYCATATI